jgi:preprotein translocase SecE subunit
MAFGIYKPGQGYWTRVMTAVMIGLITLGAGLWAQEQIKAVVQGLPAHSFQVTLRAPVSPQALPAGTGIELLGREATGELVRVGTAALSQPATAATQSLTLGSFAFEPQRDRSAVIAVRLPGGPVVTTGAGFTPVPVFPPDLAGAAALAAVLLGGALVAFYLVGVRPGSAEFLINTDFEMKKVNWSTPREIWGSTIVVASACVFLATSLWIMDNVFSIVMRFMGVLRVV